MSPPCIKRSSDQGELRQEEQHGSTAAAAAGVAAVHEGILREEIFGLEVEAALTARSARRVSDVVDAQQRLILREVREELGKDWCWSCRTFKLGPLLAKLRFLDVPARFLFPIGYAIYVAVKIQQVHSRARIESGA